MITHPLSFREQLQRDLRDKETELECLKKVDQTHENSFTLWAVDRIYDLELSIDDLKDQITQHKSDYPGPLDIDRLRRVKFFSYVESIEKNYIFPNDRANIILGENMFSWYDLEILKNNGYYFISCYHKNSKMVLEVRELQPGDNQ